VRAPSHRSGSHRSSSPAAYAKRQCKAQCRTDYEIDVAGCSALPRGKKGDCRHDASQGRKICLGNCI